MTGDGLAWAARNGQQAATALRQAHDDTTAAGGTPDDGWTAAGHAAIAMLLAAVRETTSDLSREHIRLQADLAVTRAQLSGLAARITWLSRHEPPPGEYRAQLSAALDGTVLPLAGLTPGQAAHDEHGEECPCTGGDYDTHDTLPDAQVTVWDGIAAAAISAAPGYSELLADITLLRAQRAGLRTDLNAARAAASVPKFRLGACAAHDGTAHVQVLSGDEWLCLRGIIALQEPPPADPGAPR